MALKLKALLSLLLQEYLWSNATLSLTPPTIHRGGTLAFQATVKNNTDKTGTVLFATKVTKPDHSLYPPSGYFIGPLNVPLVPYGSTPPYGILHTIPQGAPLGTYTYHGYVGKVGVGLIYECQFDFSVNP